jgi:hypothetical protein
MSIVLAKKAGEVLGLLGVKTGQSRTQISSLPFRVGHNFGLTWTSPIVDEAWGPPLGASPSPSSRILFVTQRNQVHEKKGQSHVMLPMTHLQSNSQSTYHTGRLWLLFLDLSLFPLLRSHLVYNSPIKVVDTFDCLRKLNVSSSRR